MEEYAVCPPVRSKFLMCAYVRRSWERVDERKVYLKDINPVSTVHKKRRVIWV